jgi:N-acylneuraminate cytidylyltransferase
MANLCIIPARGGSKRIPRKNIKEFLGKPIIAYSIEVALQSGLFDEVMVSTDDDEISKIAEKYGAKVPFMRSTENASDFATTRDVLIEVVDDYQKNGKQFDYICSLYPTAPLVSISNLLDGFNLLTSGRFDTILPIVAFSYPIQRSLVLEDSKIKMAHHEFVHTRSQDLPVRYHDAGQWCWMRYTSLMQSISLFTPNSGAIILEELRVQDIDNEMDWQLAELKYALLNYSQQIGE